MPFGGDQAVLSVEAYEVGHRSDKRGVNLICDALPFGRLWYLDAAAAVGLLTAPRKVIQRGLTWIYL
jgi:hypothetical protein